MKRATSTTVCSGAAPTPRAQARESADVNRWVEQLNAEMQADDATPEISTSEVHVAVEFGRATVDLTRQSLTSGELLRLEQLADEPLDLVVEGRPVARGELVVVDGQLGVRIVELLMLVAAWIVFSGAPSLADERTGSVLFDNETDQLERPFSSALGLRADSNPGKVPEANSRPRTTPSDSLGTPLSPRSDAGARDPNRVAGSGAVGWSATLWPLLFVVGLIVLAAQWWKARTPSTPRGLPVEAFELLGRKAIDQRTSVVLARCGSRLLLLNLSPQGLQTLAEITDPVEIDCLAGLCRATQRDQSLAETFRALLPKTNGTKSPTTAAPQAQEGRISERLMSARSSASPSSSEVRR